MLIKNVNYTYMYLCLCTCLFNLIYSIKFESVGTKVQCNKGIRCEYIIQRAVLSLWINGNIRAVPYLLPNEAKEYVKPKHSADTITWGNRLTSKKCRKLL